MIINLTNQFEKYSKNEMYNELKELKQQIKNEFYLEIQKAMNTVKYYNHID
jgi:hypothetical protein